MPKSDYRIEPLFLKSHVTLHLEEGARLVGPGLFENYPKTKYPRGIKGALLSGADLTDVAIVGAGGVDGKPTTTSSSATIAGVEHTAASATDGNVWTWWVPGVCEHPWLAVDLGQSTKISRIELFWRSFGPYAIEVSVDGTQWKRISQQRTQKSGQGSSISETISFAPLKTRWVRLSGLNRSDSNDRYGLFELRVFLAPGEPPKD